MLTFFHILVRAIVTSWGKNLSPSLSEREELSSFISPLSFSHFRSFSFCVLEIGFETTTSISLFVSSSLMALGILKWAVTILAYKYVIIHVPSPCSLFLLSVLAMFWSIIVLDSIPKA